MNMLCANMAQEIKKVSGREYGIHQGKPPANLISGSGREYYYSKGIIASVVEVGTRNISDYQENMLEHIREHIPAILYALKETPNYKKNGLKRVDNFQIQTVKTNEVCLKWDYEDKDVYFEIYKSLKEKSHTKEANLVGVRVVKNPFRVPLSPYDGQKIYGGKDEYTYDKFGSLDENKYFALFTYDNVPNFSEPTWIQYKKEKQ
jgi:hypothetical protein